MQAASLCRAVVAGAFGMAALLAPIPTAIAEPVPPPADPAVLVPADPTVDAAAAAVPAPNPFAANSQLTKENPLLGFVDMLSQSSPATLMIPPPAPGTAAAANPLAGVELLMPETYGMPAGDSASPYALGDGNNGPFARINAFKGVHALTHAGLGRMPREMLGQPLPGTAPPPGTSVPSGLEQFYVDPAELLPPAPVPAAAEPAPVVPAPAAIVPTPAPVG
jgi:hypothetical protein